MFTRRTWHISVFKRRGLSKRFVKSRDGYRRPWARILLETILETKRYRTWRRTNQVLRPRRVRRRTAACPRSINCHGYRNSRPKVNTTILRAKYRRKAQKTFITKMARCQIFKVVCSRTSAEQTDSQSRRWCCRMRGARTRMTMTLTIAMRRPTQSKITSNTRWSTPSRVEAGVANAVHKAAVDTASTDERKRRALRIIIWICVPIVTTP